jgi:hypothetical protein
MREGRKAAERRELEVLRRKWKCLAKGREQEHREKRLRAEERRKRRMRDPVERRAHEQAQRSARLAERARRGDADARRWLEGVLQEFVAVHPEERAREARRLIRWTRGAVRLSAAQLPPVAGRHRRGRGRRRRSAARSRAHARSPGRQDDDADPLSAPEAVARCAP